MAGHSKWKTTKHRKAINDIKKDKRFTKLIKGFTNVSNSIEKPISYNQRIKAIINKAIVNNIPKKTINKAIVRNTNIINVNTTKEITNEISTYENYGPGSAAIIIGSYNNNVNATKEVKTYLKSFGGNLYKPTVFRYLYKGIIVLPLKPNENDVMNIAIESKTEDIITYKTKIGLYTNLKAFNNTIENISSKKAVILDSNIIVDSFVNIRINKEDKPKLICFIKNIIKDQYIVYLKQNAKP